jgi:hypothetical protein
MPQKNGFHEIWEGFEEKSMLALINGDRGWLMYLEEPGDSGYSSRNPAYQGPADAMIVYSSATVSAMSIRRRGRTRSTS